MSSNSTFPSNQTGFGWNGSCPFFAPDPTGSTSLSTQVGDFFAAWISFLLISIASSQVSILVKYIGLPLITGYMFFGVLVGPQSLELISKTNISYLGAVTQFALAFISMSAGAELYLPELRALFRRILTITGTVTVVCFITCTLLIYLLAQAGLVPFMTVLSNSCQFSISLIAASIMVTQSPASAIAVVRELSAKGQFTSTFLGITVLTDIVVLLLYSICASVANANCSPNADGFNILDLVLTLALVLSAGILGYGFGKLIIFLIWIPRIQGEWLVLPLGWLVFYLSAWFNVWSTDNWHIGINFDPLLICIFAGYIVANHSKNRRKFLRFFGKCAPIIFIPFFTLTGCGLNLKVMGQGMGFAVIIFVVRALTFLGGSYAGGHWTGMSKQHKQTLWISMLTQAGVSLGIAAEVALAFPAFGSQFQSTVVSIILINQVVGPVLCKWAIKRNGEDGQGEEEEEDDENEKKRCLIIGINISSLALAQRLLKDDWHVLFIDSDARKKSMLSWLTLPTPRRLSQADLQKRDLRRKRREEKAKLRGETLPPPPPLDGDGSIPPSSSETNGEYGIVIDASKLPASAADSNELKSNSDEVLNSTNDLNSTGDLNLTSGSLNVTGGFGSLETRHAIQFRLLENVSVPLKDPVLKYVNSEQVKGLQAITGDLTVKNVRAAVVMMEQDELNYELCSLLLDSIHLTRIIVEVQNPNWTSIFAAQGVLTIFPFSLSTHMLYKTVTLPPSHPFELFSTHKPLHVSLSQTIHPDTLDTPPFFLRHLNEQEQQQFYQLHADPKIQREKWWKLDELIKVVSSAGRDEYLTQIQDANNQVLHLDMKRAASLAENAFATPGLLQDDLKDGEDEGWKKIKEKMIKEHMQRDDEDESIF